MQSIPHNTEKINTTKTNDGDTVPPHYLPSKQLNFSYMQSSRSHIFHFLFVSYKLPSQFIDKFRVILYVYLSEIFNLCYYKSHNLMNILLMLTFDMLRPHQIFFSSSSFYVMLFISLYLNGATTDCYLLFSHVIKLRFRF